MSDKNNVINFKILNTSISVMAGDDVDHVKAVATDVSELLEGIRAKNPISNHVQVAVIGCMNIAEELRELKAENSNLKRSLAESNRKTDFLFDKLEAQKIEVSQLKKKIDSKNQTIMNQKAEMASMEDQMSQSAEQLNQAKQDYDNTRQSVLSLQNQLFETQIELSRYINE